MGEQNQNEWEVLRTLREEVNWEIEEERHYLLEHLKSLIIKWIDRMPDIRQTFQRREIDWLLILDVFNKTSDTDSTPFVDMIIRSGYKDEPVLDKDGEAVSRRTTAVHHAAKRSSYDQCDLLLLKLFEIYDEFDVNYVDESGFTHFHAACLYGSVEIIENFLERGEDPNLLVTQTGDSPLHLALSRGNEKAAEWLLRNGADANLANEEGLTPLHVITKRGMHNDFELMDSFFKVNKELNKPVRVNARDKLGRTPLHLDITYGFEPVAVLLLLLKNGADPNLASNDGTTPLHIICIKKYCDDMLELFFKFTDEENKIVRVDAVDKLGRTPLQWAVANLEPDLVEILLDHGADLANFVFPTEDYFAERYMLECPLPMVVLPAITIVERLEKRGYNLSQDTAIMIMKTFAKFGLIDESVDIAERLRNDEDFARIAKKQIVSPNRSLYDFLRLPPQQAEKLFTVDRHEEFTSEISDLCNKSHKAYITYLCETVSRGFFRRWALKLFSEKSPWLSERCCEEIIDQLKVKGLWDICMKATNQNTQWLASVRTDYVKKQYNRNKRRMFT